MTREVTNSDDFIDSRDVIARITELEAELDDEQLTDDDERQELAEELERLRALADEGESLGDWQYGETLIRDSYFEDYARELAEEIGAIDSDAKWPATCIDWEKAAEELQTDYTPIEFDGMTYWARG